MATRATVMVSYELDYGTMSNGQPNPNNGIHWLQYYHHWDGYEMGVGLDLVWRLLHALESNRRHILEVLTEKKTDASYIFEECLNLSYERELASDLHGDIEYLYHIDFTTGELLVTRYARHDWKKEMHDNWKTWQDKKLIMRFAPSYGVRLIHLEDN